MSETQTPSNEDFLRDFKDLQRKVADISNSAVSGNQFAVGDLIVAIGTTRSGAVLADGATYLDTDPAIGPALAAMLRGIAVFVVDATHVKVPDYRGYALAGAGGGGFVLGTATGASAITLTATQSGLPGHLHAISAATGSTTPASVTSGAEAAHTHNMAHTHQISVAGAAGGNAIAAPGTTQTTTFTSGASSATDTGAGSSHTHSVAGSAHTHTLPNTDAIAAASAAASHPNVQPTLPANIFIKT